MYRTDWRHIGKRLAVERGVTNIHAAIELDAETKAAAVIDIRNADAATFSVIEHGGADASDLIHGTDIRFEFFG
jgi:hypothetical protein